MSLAISKRERKSEPTGFDGVPKGFVSPSTEEENKDSSVFEIAVSLVESSLDSIELDASSSISEEKDGSSLDEDGMGCSVVLDCSVNEDGAFAQEASR